MISEFASSKTLSIEEPKLSIQSDFHSVVNHKLPSLEGTNSTIDLKSWSETSYKKNFTISR